MKDLYQSEGRGPLYERGAVQAALQDGSIADLAPWLDGMLRAEQRSPESVDTKTAVVDAMRSCLTQTGLCKGRVAEIGGPFNSVWRQFPEFDFEWLSLYPVPGREEVRVCNICEADPIEDARYDMIFSISVMEHVSDPKQAAFHMRRMLKPGGIVFHAAPFSYFYHGAPADYWRYTPDAFATLFTTFKPIMGTFYDGARRRDNRGSASNPVDRDGGAAFAPDAFGGWRENWSTFFCAQKCPDWAVHARQGAVDQIVVDVMQRYVARGDKVHEAARRVSRGLLRLELSDDLILQHKSGRHGEHVKPAYCAQLYKEKGARGIAASSNAHAIHARFEYLLANEPPQAHPLRTFSSKLVRKAFF